MYNLFSREVGALYPDGWELINGSLFQCVILVDKMGLFSGALEQNRIHIEL